MEILKTNLDEAQREAAAVLDSNELVLAGPGSGKTHMLTHRVGFLLRTHPKECFRVLCLTFTVEAAKEMRRRVRELIPRTVSHRVVVMNFHQFSLELLRHYGHLIELNREFEVLGEADRAELVEDVLATLPSGRRINIYSVIDFISKRKGRREYRGDLLRDLGAASLQQIFSEYERLKSERNVLDFDDLILKAVELLEQVDWVRDLVRRTFAHIQVDELQDTSLLQLTLVQLLYDPERSHVFAVADDDQMVYEWRDARPETLLEYETTFEADVVILRYNYRCPKNIVAVANCVIANNPGRREKIVTSKREDVPGRVTLSHWNSQEDQASFIATQILSYQGADDALYRNCAALVRYRQSLLAIQSALEEYGIPFVEIGSKDIEDSPFVRILMGCLRLVAGQPYGQEATRRACGKANQLLESDVFQVKQVLISAKGMVQQYDRNLIHALAKELNVIEVLESYGHDADALRMRRFLDIVDLAKSESNWQDYPAMLRTLTFEFNSLQVRVNMQYDAVRLMTVHAAKGLQFPMVFIPDLSDGTFPNLRSRARRPNMPEERRVLFVAITRAQEEAHLSWADIGPYGYPADASPFIDEALQVDNGCIEWLSGGEGEHNG